MFLKSRVERLERADRGDVKINVSCSEGGCPTPEEKARIRAANPNKTYIWVCSCPNCRGDNGRF